MIVAARTQLLSLLRLTDAYTFMLLANWLLAAVAAALRWRSAEIAMEWGLLLRCHSRPPLQFGAECKDDGHHDARPHDLLFGFLIDRIKLFLAKRPNLHQNGAHICLDG